MRLFSVKSQDARVFFFEKKSKMRDFLSSNYRLEMMLSDTRNMITRNLGCLILCEVTPSHC